jgi:glyoxylase-like metal-dependent hydrolase (beta-lactamase superfamily II)
VFTAEPVTLFDCGPNTPATETALLLGLAGLGLHPEQIARVVISHGHPDHYGLAPRIRELSGAEILIGEGDAEKLRGRLASP